MAALASDATSASSEAAADDDEDRKALARRLDRTAAEEELIVARLKVAQQEEELTLLRTNRTKMEAEVQELTASLFEEANRMVNDAAMDRFCTEKALKEAQLQIEGLQAEVAALKTLVLTSTPSNPNLSHHHGAGSPIFSASPSKLFSKKKGHQKCASHGSIGAIFGFPHGDHSPSGSPVGSPSACAGSAQQQPLCCDHDCKKGRGKRHFHPRPVCRSMSNELGRGDDNSTSGLVLCAGAGGLVTTEDLVEEEESNSAALWDPQLLNDFCNWRQRCGDLPPVASLIISDDGKSPMKGEDGPGVAEFNFLREILEQELSPCLEFPAALKRDLKRALREDAVIIECRPCDGEKRDCALLLVPRRCDYLLRLSDGDPGVPISEICRNRITAVCDFLNYLKYIQLGLVKSPDESAVQEIMRLRKNMALAKLGYSID